MCIYIYYYIIKCICANISIQCPQDLVRLLRNLMKYDIGRYWKRSPVSCQSGVPRNICAVATIAGDEPAKTLQCNVVNQSYHLSFVHPYFHPFGKMLSNEGCFIFGFATLVDYYSEPKMKSCKAAGAVCQNATIDDHGTAISTDQPRQDRFQTVAPTKHKLQMGRRPK